MRTENDLLHQACLKELSLEEYKQIVIILSNAPKNYLMDSLTPFDIIKILSFLDFYDVYSYEVSMDITRYLLCLFPNDFALSSSELLTSIITVDNYTLSTMIFDELSNRIINNSPQNEPIHFTEELIKLVLNFVFEENTELSSASQKLLINFCKQSKEACKQAFIPIIQSKFVKISNNSVHLFRYLDVILEIAVSTLDKELFEIVIGNEIVDKFNEVLRKDDILSHINIVEMIRKLVGNQLGYQLLTHSGILNNLYIQLPLITQGPFNNVLLPGYLTVFAELANDHCIEALKSYSGFVAILSEQFESNDKVLKMQVLEMAATIASIPDCKLFIHTHYDLLIPKALKELMQLFDRSTVEYKIRSGLAMANIFSVPSDSKQYDNLCEINRHWFESINNNNKLIGAIFDMIRLPSEDIKLTGLRFAVAISNQRWAMHLIGDNSSLVDFLMQRSDEWKSCIDMKFQLITNLINGINDAITNGNNVQKLQQYHKEGKYYAVFHAEMMVDTDV